MRARYAAFMQTGAPLGIIIASLVGGFLVSEIGWRACFFVSIAPAFLVTYIRKWLPESDVWLERKRKIADGTLTDASMKTMDNLKILFSKTFRLLFLQSLVLSIFEMSAYWFTYSWLPGYLHQQRGFTIVKSAAWMLVTQAGGFSGYLTFGFTADKIGRRPAFSIYSVIMALGLLMITLFWSIVAVNYYYILFFMFLTGFGTGMFSGLGPLFSEIFPTSIRNTAMGSAFNLARGIQFLTPVIITIVARTYGLSGGISLAAGFALLTGLWVWTFPETRGSSIS
jgi:MFS family permease